MAAPRRPAQPGPPGIASAAPRRTRRIRGLDAEQRRAQRREQLLTTAFDLFTRDGYANTSIEQICQTAYVGNKAFYELFDSKEDCYLALLRETSERIEQQISQAMQQSADDETDEEGTIVRLLSAFAHALVDDPRIAVVTFGMAAGISPRIEAQRRENRRWAASFIEAFWCRNQPADDRIRGDHIDYHALAVATVGGLFEAVTDWLHDTDPPRTIDNLISNLTTFMSVVEAGIATRTSTGPTARDGQG
jgi:AcrR family transcriptional regulator